MKVTDHVGSSAIGAGFGAGADAALAFDAQSGDAAAFGELYERHRQLVYRYCLALELTA